MNLYFKLACERHKIGLQQLLWDMADFATKDFVLLSFNLLNV